MSPRKGGTARPIVGIRIKPDAITLIDQLATEAGVTRSEMCRRLLAEALAARQKAGRLPVAPASLTTFTPITAEDVQAFRTASAQFADAFMRHLDSGAFRRTVEEHRTQD